MSDSPRYFQAEDSVLMLRTDWDGPELALAVQQDGIAIAFHLTRDHVRDLAVVLEDWLYDSRPT